MVDELPVGGGNNQLFQEEQTPNPTNETNDESGKPLEQRLVSKNWSTRADAYKQLTEEFKKSPLNCQSDTFQQHASEFPKYLVDANPGSLEKALECFQAFIDKAKPSLLAQNQIATFKPMIEKCLGHAKPVIKQKSMECVMSMLASSENFDEDTLDAIEEFCKSKNAKVQQVSIGLLSNFISGFGIKRFKPARFASHIENAANSSNPAVRNEAMNCYKSLYLWVGDAVETFIDKLKQQQKDQLKKDFEELKSKPQDHKRLTKSEQAKQKEAQIDAAIAEESKIEEVDVFDLAAPKNLSQFDSTWQDAVLSLKKWDEKRDKLIELATEANVPKIGNGDWNGLCAMLKKLMSDSNIVVSQNAVKAVGPLANGLRSGFATQAKELVPVLFSRLKEKRVIEDVQTSLSNILMCVSLNELMESIPAGLSDKNPQIKKNVALFIEKAVLTTYIDELEEIQGELLPLIAKTVEDNTADVRDQGLRTLGILQGRLGEPALQKYVEGLNTQKKEKVTEAANSVKPSKYDKSQKKAAAEAAAKKRAEAAAAKKKAVAPPKKAEVITVGEDEEMKETPGENKGGIVLDDLDMGPPKKPVAKKPPNIGQKPPSRKEKEAAAATASTPKPATKSVSTTKGPSAPQIADEDVGTGLSKEEAIEKAKEFYDSEHIKKVEDSKWQDRQQGMQGIQEQIKELKPNTEILEATAKYIKVNMKDWKESNVNLIKEAIITLKTMTENCEKIPKRVATAYSSFLVDKIGDVKVSTMVKEVIMELAEFVTCKFISLQIIKYASQAKAPNNLKESCLILSQLCDEFGGAMMPLKETIQYAIIAANHSNVQVRNASMSLFATLYKHAGPPVRSFLTDIKDSTLKLIEAEFDKVTPLKKGEFKSNRQVKGEAAEEMAAAPSAAASLEDALPREDISKQLNSKLFALFKDKDWKKRKEGAEQVEAILKGAKMRIKPDGCNELMDCMKNAMKEANKAVMKANIGLLGNLAEAMGQPIKNYQKKCLAPMILQLSDKQSLVRADVIASMDKWAEAIGPECVINHTCAALATENPELRDEGLKWILAHKDSIAQAENSSLVKPLISCLSDKAVKIRSAAEEIIVIVMSQVGFSTFNDSIKDLKPALQQTVRPILEKCKSKCASNVTEDVHMSEEAPKQVQQKPAGPTRITHDNQLNKSIPKQPTLVQATISTTPRKTAQTLTAPAQESQPANSFAIAASNKPTLKTTITPSKAPLLEEDDLKINPGNKEKRAQLDSKNKWMHEELKPEQVDKFKHICEQIFGLKYMKDKMFSTDFKKHVMVINDFQNMIEAQSGVLVEILDIVFKWCYIRLTESANTTFAVNVFDFLQILFEFLKRDEIQLWDHEAYIIIPLLCEKAGLNNAILKEKVKSLIKTSFEIYDEKKCMGLIIKFGVGNKNLKSVSESLDEVAHHISIKGVETLTEKDLKFVAKLADSADKGVRESSLVVLAEIYKVLDEGIWKIIGNVTPKVKGLLEARFKKTKGLSGSDSQVNLGLSMTSRTKAEFGLARSLVAGQVANQISTPRSLQFNKVQAKGNNDGHENMNKSIGGRFNQSINSNGGAQPLVGGNRPLTAQQNMRFQSGLKPSQNQQIEHQFYQPDPQSQDQNNIFQNQHVQQEQVYTQQQQDVLEDENKQMFPDDDEDLRQQINDLQSSQDKVQYSPRTKAQMDEIMKNVQALKYGNLGKRVDSLVNLNEQITKVQEYEKSLALCANELVQAFNLVLKDIFERPPADIPIRFAKYFVTIVNKACSTKEIMKEVDEQHCADLSEQLLTRLLIDGLNENKEGELILKNLNASMLRMLENCNHTYIFCVLFNHLRTYKDTKVLPKLPGLIIKCLLKLSKILEKLIDKLDMERVLLAIHEYMVSIDHDNKSSNDEMGIRIVKTVVNELVKLKRDQIWTAYRVVECHQAEDNHIKRWIKIILASLQNVPASEQPQAPSRQTEPDSQAQTVMTTKDKIADIELRKIIDDMRSTDGFDQTLPKLNTFLINHPDINFESYLSELTPNFANFIRTQLESYQKSLAETGSTSHGTKVNNFFQDEGRKTQPNPSATERLSHVSENPSVSSSQSKFGQHKFISRQASDLHQKLGMSASKNNQEMAAEVTASNQGTKTGFKMAQTSRPMTATNAQSQSQQAQSFSSATDRINQYQSKLSSMREKFQQRKSNNPEPVGSQQKQQTGEAGQQSSASGQKNLNTSFLAMNSSLQAKWSAISNKNQNSLAQDKINQQMSSTMIGGQAQRVSLGQSTSSFNAGSNLNRSSNVGDGGSSNVGATTQELNRRLADMKQKLQALKKKD